MARSNAAERALVEEMFRIMDAQEKTVFSRTDILEIADRLKVSPSSVLNKTVYRAARNQYKPVDLLLTTSKTPPKVKKVPSGKVKDHEETLVKQAMVPAKDSTFVPFGRYADVHLIVESNRFYPVYLVGLSGFGKTTMVEQACASAKREVIRVNVSIETDEDDLIGGFVLEQGNVVFREGPVLVAMRRGAVLILDEIDRGSNKLMCLQAILEGKPYYNKKTNRVYEAVPGFNIFATGNTKGQGIEDGKYMSAQILDEAFLERFALTLVCV